MDDEQWLPRSQAFGLEYGWLALKALLSFVIGRIVVKIVTHIVNRAMKRFGMGPMLAKFLRDMVYAVLLTFVVIETIGALGMKTASLVAVIGAAARAIVLALQGSLANLVAGMLMIVFRPHTLGDLVEVAGTARFVEEVDVFAAVLRTLEKVKIIIPNDRIMSDEIINYTDTEKRRLDLVVGVSCGDDIDKAREVLLAVIKRSEYVLQEPAPQVTVAELGDSSVNLAVRP